MPIRRICLFLLAALFTGFTGCVTTDEENAAVVAPHLGMEAQFNSADTDKNGKLTTEEVILYHHEELLVKYDLDDDDHLSAAEWKKAHPSATEVDPRFNEIDRNKDRKLSKAEAVSWVSERVSFGDAFKKYDQDGDFNLHWKELNANAPAELRVTMFSLPLG